MLIKLKLSLGQKFTEILQFELSGQFNVQRAQVFLSRKQGLSFPQEARHTGKRERALGLRRGLSLPLLIQHVSLPDMGTVLPVQAPQLLCLGTAHGVAPSGTAPAPPRSCWAPPPRSCRGPRELCSPGRPAASGSCARWWCRSLPPSGVAGAAPCGSARGAASPQEAPCLALVPFSLPPPWLGLGLSASQNRPRDEGQDGVYSLKQSWRNST